MTVAFEQETAVREPNRVLGTLLLLVPLMGALSIALALFGQGAFVTVGAQFLLTGWPIRSRVYRENWRATVRRARVRVTEEGVFIDGRLAHAVSAIADGYTVLHAGGRGVRLVDARRRILCELDVGSEEEANGILAAAGIGVSRRRARFDTALPSWASRQTSRALAAAIGAVVAVGVAWFALLPHFGRAVPLLLLVIAALLIVPVHVRGALEVGADGLLLRWLWIRRFISYDEVRGVERSEGGVTIGVAAGPNVDVNLSGAPDEVARKKDAVVDRIRQSLAAHRPPTTVGDLAARLARGGRPLAEWQRELAAMRDAERGYRQGAVRPGDLWLVLEDPGAPEDARAAAAMLLRGGSDDSRSRLRVAAETTVSPRLRVALDVAASERETVSLEDALADFDDGAAAGAGGGAKRSAADTRE